MLSLHKLILHAILKIPFLSWGLSKSFFSVEMLLFFWILQTNLLLILLIWAFRCALHLLFPWPLTTEKEFIEFSSLPIYRINSNTVSEHKEKYSLQLKRNELHYVRCCPLRLCPTVKLEFFWKVWNLKWEKSYDFKDPSDCTLQPTVEKRTGFLSVFWILISLPTT